MLPARSSIWVSCAGCGVRLSVTTAVIPHCDLGQSKQPWYSLLTVQQQGTCVTLWTGCDKTSVFIYCVEGQGAHCSWGRWKGKEWVAIDVTGKTPFKGTAILHLKHVLFFSCRVVFFLSNTVEVDGTSHVVLRNPKTQIYKERPLSRQK